MKTFLTGATGFIGTHVVRRLAQTNHQMVCLIRNPSKAKELKELGVLPFVGDLTDKDCVREGMRGCDSVINLASIYAFWVPDKRVFQKVNVEGTRNVLESAVAAKVSKVVHVSTAVIFGKPIDSPYTEESTPGPERFSDYAQSKYEEDLIAQDLFVHKGLPLVTIYPVGVLGPGDPKASGDYIQALIHRQLPATVLNDSTLTWVHVKDVAEAIVRALEKENNIGEKYLVGKEQVTIRQYNRMVSEISGVPLPILSLPDSVAMLNAALLTWLADIIKKPPLWGMSTGQMRTMKEGFRCNGSKVEKELGLSYTPIRVALEEAIASYRKPS